MTAFPSSASASTSSSLSSNAYSASQLFNQFSRPASWPQKLLDESSDLIYVVSPGGKIIYTAPSCKQVVGFSQEELVGHHLGEFVHPDDVRSITQAINTSLANLSTYSLIHRFRRKNADYIILEVSGRPFHLPPSSSSSPSATLSNNRFNQLNGSSSSRDQYSSSPPQYVVHLAREYPSKPAQLMDAAVDLKVENELLKKRLIEYQNRGIPISTSLGISPSDLNGHGNSSQQRIRNFGAMGTEIPPSSLNVYPRIHIPTSTSSVPASSSSLSQMLSLSTEAPPSATSIVSSLPTSVISRQTGDRLQSPVSGIPSSLASPPPQIPVSVPSQDFVGFSGLNMNLGGMMNGTSVSMPSSMNMNLNMGLGNMMDSNALGMGLGVGLGMGFAPENHVGRNVDASTLNQPVITGSGTATNSTATVNVNQQAQNTAPLKKPRKRRAPAKDEDYVCVDCGTTQSPEWRKGPTGAKTLCNACGLRYAKRRKAELQAQQSHRKSDDTNPSKPSASTNPNSSQPQFHQLNSNPSSSSSSNSSQNQYLQSIPRSLDLNPSMVQKGNSMTLEMDGEESLLDGESDGDESYGF